ncbi:hypothetical protein A6R68_17591, partial [Neotoma lepida]
EKVDNDYSALQERLRTLPDKLSYDVMAAGDIVDIREEIKSDFEFKDSVCLLKKVQKTVDQQYAEGCKNLASINSLYLFDLINTLTSSPSKPDTVIANGEYTVSLEEEKEDQGTSVNVVPPVTDSFAPGSCGMHAQNAGLPNGQASSHLNCSVNGSNSYHSNEEDEDDDDEDEDTDDDDDDDGDESDHTISADNSVPTIYFSHTVEPKRVRINTGKNTTLKFSEKKEEAKRKRKSSAGSHATHELPAIRSPADIYRVFVDVVNGEYVPRKSILKSRSRENSVCSDTSESSAADVDDRRGVLRSTSWEEASCIDASGSTLEELQENQPKKLLPSGVSEAFSGTVIEKEFSSPSLAPCSAIAHHALPTIPERKEVLSEAPEEPAKRVSKFKAARLQQRS